MYVFVLLGFLSSLSSLHGQASCGVINYQIIDDPSIVDYNEFVFEDSEKNVWITSLQGVTKYDNDGATFYSLNSHDNLTGSYIQSGLFEDVNKNIWFSSYEYLIRFSHKNGSFSKYQFKLGDELSKQYHLFHLNNEKDEGWLVADGVIVRFSLSNPNDYFVFPKRTRGRRFSFDQIGDSIRIIGSPWIQGTGIDLIKIEGNKITLDSIASRKDGNGIYIQGSHILQDSAFLFASQGVYLLDLVKNEIVGYNDFFSDGLISDFAVFDDRNFIISTISSGMWLYNKDSGRFSLWDKTECFGTSIDYINKTKSHLALSRTDSSIEFISLECLECFESTGILNWNENIISMDENEGKTYVLCEKELYELENMQLIKKADLPKNDAELHKLLVRDGYFYVSSLHKLYRKKVDVISNWELIHSSNDELVLDFTIYEGEIVVVTANDVFRYGKLKGELKQKIKEVKWTSFGRLFDLGDDGLWVSVENSMVVRIDESYTDSIYIGLEPKSIEILNGQSDLLIGTNSGLYLKSGDSSTYEILDKRWELGGVNILDMDIVGSDSIVVISKDQIRFVNFKRKSVTRFPFSLSLSPDAFQNHTLIEGDSVIRYIEDNTIVSRSIFECMIESRNPSLSIVPYVFDNGEELFIEEGVRLPSEYNSIFINVSVSDLLNPLNEPILYRVKNVASEWRITDGLVELINYKQGDYSVDFKFPNSNYVITYSFSILPPYHQTWWFRTTSVLGLLGLGFGGNTLNTKRKLKAAQIKLDQQAALSAQREKIADDLHDELGTELSKILYLSDEATETKDIQKKEELVHDITNLAASSITNMRDMLWVLEQKNDTLESLLVKIRSSVQHTLKDYSINATFERENISKPETIQVSGEIRQQILLIVKEAIHNVIKHADSSEVIVASKLITDKEEALSLSVSVRDNGVGSSGLNEYATKGRGLASMRKRAEQIEGTLVIDSAESKGTTITVSVDIGVV